MRTTRGPLDGNVGAAQAAEPLLSKCTREAVIADQSLRPESREGRGGGFPHDSLGPAAQRATST